MRKRTGLRNKWRNGRGTYSLKRKRINADRYGRWERGKRAGGETIAGRNMDYKLGDE